MITPIALECIICRVTGPAQNAVINAQRRRNLNPGLCVRVNGARVELSLTGLRAGVVGARGPANPAATRLDFYVGKTALMAQRNMFPSAGVRPSARSTQLTNATGTQRRGGKRISWRGPIYKLPPIPTTHWGQTCEP